MLNAFYINSAASVRCIVQVHYRTSVFMYAKSTPILARQGLTVSINKWNEQMEVHEKSEAT